MEFILFIFLGLVSGLLGGLLGVGGGMITVPALYALFHFSGMYPHKVMHIAVGTSLACAVVTTAVSTWFQSRKKSIDYAAFRYLAPGLIFGCICGAVLAHFLASNYLKIGFGTFAVLLGISFFFPQWPRFSFASEPNQSLSLFGILIGTLSSMLGIGGGSLTFPVLLGYRVSVKHSAATSSFSTLISTVIGTITYLILAKHWAGIETFGYIQLPAFIGISGGSILTSPIGVHLSQILDAFLIRRIFGCTLILIGISMFVL